MAEVFDFGLQQHKIKMDGKFFENNLFAVAGDTGRRLEVQLLDSNNMVQNTAGISLRLNAVVAGQATYAEATLVDATKGLYELDLPNGMLISPGNWQFQWQIIGATGEKLHSFAFMGSVGSNLSEGASEATNFYLNVDDLKQMQEDLVNGTFNSEVLETNIAEKLNNLEEQYAPKLTEVTARLAETKKHVNTKSFFVDDYSSYKLGSDWSPAIDQIYNEIVALGGGNVVFSNGTYNISRPLPVVSYISYIGQGYRYTILKYTSSDSNNIVTINIKNVTLRNLTLQGSSKQLGHGISIFGTQTNLVGETTLDNLRLCYCGKSGLYIGNYVFMNIANNLRFENNDEHGFYDQGTDNTYSNLHASGNKFNGLYLAGRNGRYSNIKSIYNGSGGAAYAGIYISGGRLQLSNLEAQDNFYDGIVFDGCVESVASNLISDASGWAYETAMTPIISARGFVFKNDCHHITAKGLYACCYYGKKIQKRGLDVDSSCSFLNIEYDQNEKVFVNDYLSSGNLAVEVKTPNTTMLQKHLGTGKMLYNLITQPLLTSDSAFIGSVGTTSKTYANGVATIVFGSDSPRRVDFNNATLQKGHLYYFSVDVRASEITELTVSIFKNKNTTPPYNNIESKKVMGNNDYVNFSFLIYLFDNDTNYHLTVGSSANSTIYSKQPICVDLTADLGIVCNPTNRYTFDTKFIDELIRQTGGFFATSKVI